MILNKKIWSWALYDWANSAFSCTIVAGFFPIFFEKFWSNPDDVIQSTFQLGIANSASSIIIAILSPILGAIADRGSVRKKFLFTFAFLGAVMTGSLFFLNQGQWQFAIVIYILASVGFMGGNIFYDSLLPNLAEKDKVDYVSLLGYSLGYLGGGLLFLVNVLMYLYPDWFGIEDSTMAIRISFVTVGIWWATFSLPMFIFVPEQKVENSVPFFQAARIGFVELKKTFRRIKKMKTVVVFLSAYWLYIDGVDTIIKMAVKIGSSLGFETSDLITALLMAQFIAFPSALLYNWFSKKIGVKNAVFIAIFGYAFSTFLAFFMESRTHFFCLAALIGIFQGGIQALSRSLFTRLIPKNREAEFFGFYNMLGKFASVIGPFLIGWITLITGNIRFGILSILFLFISGGFLLSKVDFKKGEEEALNFEK
ncbi:MAG: MFS transporter [Candidatus Neomarinimicrobiota bacterium]